MLRIWGRTSSTNVQKVLWCCAELGLPFERIEAGGSFGGVATPEYKAMNPNALVPTLDDDGFILWESNVIVRYLCKLHGDGTLYPSAPQTQFVAEQWMDWQTTTLWPAFRVAFLGMIRTPPEERDNAAIEKSRTTTAGRMQGLETRLGKTRFVAGDAFTMGDIPLGPPVHRILSVGIDRKDFPNVGRWYDEMTARPAFREHVMLPLS